MFVWPHTAAASSGVMPGGRVRSGQTDHTGSVGSDAIRRGVMPGGGSGQVRRITQGQWGKMPSEEGWCLGERSGQKGKTGSSPMGEAWRGRKVGQTGIDTGSDTGQTGIRQGPEKARQGSDRGQSGSDGGQTGIGQGPEKVRQGSDRGQTGRRGVRRKRTGEAGSELAEEVQPVVEGIHKCP